MGRPGFSLQRRLARRRQEARAAPEGDAPAASGPTESNAPAMTGTSAPGFWSRFEAGMARARSLAVSTAVLVVLGVVGWSVAQELIRDPVIIEPLAVPESVAKAGWTGEVLARQIRDGVRDINGGSKTRQARADYLFDREQLDIVLPGASVSIRTLVTIVRGVLGRPARRVAGEVVELDDRERSAACKHASSTEARYLLVGRLNNAGRWAACAGSVGELQQEAAKELVRTVTPYIYACFQYEHNREDARDTAEAILAEGARRAEHAGALNLLGIMLIDENEFSRAIESFEEAVYRNPHYTYSYINWGNALFLLGRPNEALDKYRVAVDRNPDLAESYYNWGRSLQVMERLTEAISKYEQAVRREPEYVPAYNNWGHALMSLKRPKEAIEKYAEALRYDPHSAAAYNGWGNALLNLKRPEEAINKYEEAAQRDPSLTYLYFNWGNALLDLKRFTEAIDKYEQEARRNPDDADVYRNWAIALRSIQKSDEADEKWNTYKCVLQHKKIDECSPMNSRNTPSSSTTSTKQ